VFATYPTDNSKTNSSLKNQENGFFQKTWILIKNMFKTNVVQFKEPSAQPANKNNHAD
jgi:hypothetical protein